MAAGLRYKWQGSSIKIMIGFQGDSPSDTAITAISKANPAVVTSNGHGLSNGDVVRLVGIVGMTELNNGVFLVNNKAANTFELFGVDSTGYATYVSGGFIDVGEFSNLCELTNYNRQGGSSPEIDATSLCSDAAEYEIGLPDFGTTALDFNFAPLTSNVQGVLHDFYLSGDVTGVKVTLPKSGGSMTLLGFVQQESETAGNGGIWKATATLRNTGNRLDLVAA